MLKELWKYKKLRKAFIELVIAIVVFIICLINTINVYKLIEENKQQKETINELRFELEYNNFALEDSLKQ